METPVYFAGIHTMQVRTSNNPEKRFEHQLKPYVKEYKTVNGVGVYQLNPNKYDEQGFLKSFSAFLETMKKIFEELELTDFIIERIDLSLNTVTEYDEIFKLNVFLPSESISSCKTVISNPFLLWVSTG